jgi:hypothetical protein
MAKVKFLGWAVKKIERPGHPTTKHYDELCKLPHGKLTREDLKFIGEYEKKSPPVSKPIIEYQYDDKGTLRREWKKTDAGKPIVKEGFNDIFFEPENDYVAEVPEADLHLYQKFYNGIKMYEVLSKESNSTGELESLKREVQALKMRMGKADKAEKE